MDQNGYVQEVYVRMLKAYPTFNTAGLKKRAQLIVAHKFGGHYKNDPSEAENAFIERLFEEFATNGFMNKKNCQEALYKYLQKGEEDKYSFRELGLLDDTKQRTQAREQTEAAFDYIFDVPGETFTGKNRLWTWSSSNTNVLTYYQKFEKLL